MNESPCIPHETERNLGTTYRPPTDGRTRAAAPRRGRRRSEVPLHVLTLAVCLTPPWSLVARGVGRRARARPSLRLRIFRQVLSHFQSALSRVTIASGAEVSGPTLSDSLSRRRASPLSLPCLRYVTSLHINFSRSASSTSSLVSFATCFSD